MKQLEVGNKASITKCFNEADVETFARVSGDTNPLHLDDTYAKDSIFKQRVVHGALVNSLFSNLLGNVLPGEGTIYCKQNSSFTKPVFLNDEITATVEITSIDKLKHRIYFTTTATNHHNDLVIKGDAMVLYKP